MLAMELDRDVREILAMPSNVLDAMLDRITAKTKETIELNPMASMAARFEALRKPNGQPA